MKERKFVTKDNATINYIDEGSGQPLIFLHGWGGNLTQLKWMYPKFNKKYRVIAFDDRGCGKSDHKGELSLHQAARDLKELIEHLKLEKVVLHGLSMGGNVLFAYIEQFGCQHLDKVVITDMTPKLLNDDTWDLGVHQGWYKEQDYKKDLKLMEKDYNEFLMTFFYLALVPFKPTEKRIFEYDEAVKVFKKKSKLPLFVWNFLLKSLVGLPLDEKRQISSKAYWDSMVFSDFRPILKDIKVPALILYNDPGSIYEPRTAEYLGENIDNATLKTLGGPAHGGMNRKEFVNNMMQFLQK